MSTRFQTSQSNVWQIFASLQVLDPKKKLSPAPQKYKTMKPEGFWIINQVVVHFH